MKYRVIFKGQITHGKKVSRVAQQLASVLNSDQSRIRHLFSGKTFVILSDADLRSCQTLKAVFEKAGAICHIAPQPPQTENQTRNLSSGTLDPGPPPLPEGREVRRDDSDRDSENEPKNDQQLLAELDEMPDPDQRRAKSKADFKAAQDLIAKFSRKFSNAFVDTENISARHREFIKKVTTYLFTIGEGAVELIINLAIMVMVERTYDQRGLGVYAYLLSLFFIVGYLSEFGISRFAEHEIAKHHDNQAAQIKIVSECYRSMLGLSLIFAVLFFLTAGWNTDHTRIGERVAAYLIIGATLPLRNLNRLKLAALHALGRHEVAAQLKMIKRLVLLGTISLLIFINIPPSFLLIAFLVSETALKLVSARKYKLARIKTSWMGLLPKGDTLLQGYRFLFTDEMLDIVLYLDFFILGLFVSSWKLGVYAEASIMVRFLLLVPISLKPIFRRQYCMLAARQASELLNRTTRFMFFFQALLTLFILLHFPDFLNLVFNTRGEELLSCKIFAVFAPGLIFFAVVTFQETVYETAEKLSDLKKVVLIVSAVDLMLNIYLIPYAGVLGAAAATMISMLVYFFIFDRYLAESWRIKKAPYLFAGSAVYLLHALMKAVRFSLLTDFFLIPLGLFMILLAMGYFHLAQEQTS